MIAVDVDDASDADYRLIEVDAASKTDADDAYDSIDDDDKR